MYKWLDCRSSCFQLAASTSLIKDDHVGCFVSQQICKHITSSSSLGQTLYTTSGLFAHCLLLIPLTITLQTLPHPSLPPVLLNPYCTLSPSCRFRLKLVQDLVPLSIIFQGWLSTQTQCANTARDALLQLMTPVVSYAVAAAAEFFSLGWRIGLLCYASPEKGCNYDITMLSFGHF